MGYSANTGDPSGDARFQRWDARLGRSMVRTQDQIAITTGGGCARDTQRGVKVLGALGAVSWVALNGALIQYSRAVCLHRAALKPPPTPPPLAPPAPAAATPAAGFRLYDGPVHFTNLTARAWPAGTAALAVRSSNGFQMAAGSSVRGFRPEGCSYRFVVQVRIGPGLTRGVWLIWPRGVDHCRWGWDQGFCGAALPRWVGDQYWEPLALCCLPACAMHHLPQPGPCPLPTPPVVLLHPTSLAVWLDLQDAAGDGGRTATLRDLDGSVSGYPGATLLPDSPSTSLGFYSAPGCVAHPAYGIACPQVHFVFLCFCLNFKSGLPWWLTTCSASAVVVGRCSCSCIGVVYAAGWLEA